MWIPNFLAALRYPFVQDNCATRARLRRSQPAVSAEVLEHRLCLSSAPFIPSLVLLNDTGEPDDFITEDPTITGTVTNGDSGDFEIEIDYDGDGIWDDFTLADSSGVFVYDPSWNLAYGEATIFVRAREWNETEGFVYSEWVSISFIFEATPQAGSLEIATLELLNDTGVPGDLITEDSTITGSVTDGTTGVFQIEIDFDDDGVREDLISADSSGTFVYDPSWNLGFGEVTIFVRAREYDVVSGYIYSEWVSITFTWTEAGGSEGTVPEVTYLALTNDTGDPGDFLTEDPTITGSVSNDDGLENLIVEIDFDGDGIADDWVTTDSNGYFEYDPSWAIGYGEVTISVRVVASDASGDIYGEWTAITFTFLEPEFLLEL